MGVDVLLGLQWGDEGKGKIVDVLTPNYDVVARFQGGPNAGHTLKINGKSYVLHTIPSGIFHDRPVNLIGNGVVIDPVVFKKEIKKLVDLGIDIKSRLFISKKAHIILPTHRLLDAASEKSKGDGKIGSTLKGIGPTYMDKTGRNGLRVGDILLPSFKDDYDFLVKKHEKLLTLYDLDYNLSEYEEEFFEGIALIKSLNIVDSEHFINKQIKNKKDILAEGAQGSMLDIDFGTYPYVTSSNTTSSAACTGLGIAPKHIREVIGIAKAYCTRVGNGPFPTELNDETGQKLRDIGQEYGATTGRPRRCGWIDLPALRYTMMLSGVTQLIITKADVLNAFSTIKACTHYKYNGEEIDYMPYDIEKEAPAPIYHEAEGWNCEITDKTPAKLESYLDFLEEQLQVKITMISTGPGREQILKRTSEALT